ncbi:MAG: CDP-diacylglycerol--serine O-phosphatidyltransferase [Candidatus Marinimicrobia bacterium CG08_land_8_20_14_0_20_45_22]|nr:MAG: CDP-diacylglycerol--serine O-phosphatidyltransferase [Candidatus Marinimicrobia bacterium CG08_land_8_20_14_0_20_45_22]
MRFRKSIPSIFTIFNMFSGFLAILQIFQGHYITAVMLITLASIFDGLDGKVARLLQQQSDFGIEFDSLADIISFCAAPAILVHDLYVADLGIIGAIISFFPLLFGGLRLARFNIHATYVKNPYFSGLPVPVSALTIGSFVWFNYVLFGNYGDSKIALPMVVVLSFLMVSNIRFSAKMTMSFTQGAFISIRTASILLLALSVLIFQGYVIFPIMFMFIVTHLLMWLVGYEEPRVRFSLRRRAR